VNHRSLPFTSAATCELIAHDVIGRGPVKHDQTDVAQKQGGGIQITDRA
jgi:hypothetical protein